MRLRRVTSEGGRIGKSPSNSSQEGESGGLASAQAHSLDWSRCATRTGSPFSLNPLTGAMPTELEELRDLAKALRKGAQSAALPGYAEKLIEAAKQLEWRAAEIEGKMKMRKDHSSG